MNEQYPIHIMIKPEGLELFPDYITSQIQNLEATLGNGNYRKLRTILTPEEVEMIYPKNSAPSELKEYLSKNETEHHFLFGDSSIYQHAKEMKGKYGLSEGVRGVVTDGVNRLGIKMEKWKNYIHTSDSESEAHSICFNSNSEINNCASCAARTLCYRN